MTSFRYPGTSFVTLRDFETYDAWIHKVKRADRSTHGKLYRPSLEVAHTIFALIPLARTQSLGDYKGDYSSNVREVWKYG